ncbi:MAG: DUF2164 domain-containing protein [Henriciella sp.]|nr:DUF2164 domain-containing protein [Henriciella sp.]
MPTRLRIDPERRETLIAELQTLYRDELDEEISAFRAEQIFDLMINTLGPGIYNQAVQDVRAHLQGKLDDLDGEVYFDGDTE